MFDSQSGEDKVRKFVLFLTLTTGMSGTAMAEGWEFSQSGTARTVLRHYGGQRQA